MVSLSIYLYIYLFLGDRGGGRRIEGKGILKIQLLNALKGGELLSYLLIKYDDCPHYRVFIWLLYILQSKDLENLIFDILTLIRVGFLGVHFAVDGFLSKTCYNYARNLKFGA